MIAQEQWYKYLQLLSEKYPTRQSVYAELIHLNGVLSLPKPTEHFMSDLHGEYESFFHILNNCSGVIKEKVDKVFTEKMSDEEKADFCTLIYYPLEKLTTLKKKNLLSPEYYKKTILNLLDLSKFMSYKYQPREINNAIPEGYGSIIDELLRGRPDADYVPRVYRQKMLDTLISIGSGDDFIFAFTVLIKRLAVARLHIVGDFFDRGKRPDAILNMLMEHHSIDIQWGNHDVLWMGAACGSETCIAEVVRITLKYNNIEVLERGYAISVRPLFLFAARMYPHDNPIEAAQKAIAVILFKQEAAIIKRNPDFAMQERLLLHKINYKEHFFLSHKKEYEMQTDYFPTIDPSAPFSLTEEEYEIIRGLQSSFIESRQLQRHIQFLYKKGSLYKCYNGNLLFHGCVPVDDEGRFRSIHLEGKNYSGRAYLDYVEQKIRQAYFGEKDQFTIDFMWYLWCGINSPVSGREMKTFERIFVKDKSLWEEPSDAYFRYYDKDWFCEQLLQEFGLDPNHGHIINGHVPIKVKDGETPIKAKGKAIVIDGGFCRAYHKKTGIAGFTLVSNSRGLRLIEHRDFTNVKAAIMNNKDIESVSESVEVQSYQTTIADTEEGEKIQEQINDLYHLMLLYKNGILKPLE
ncbi:fructose-1,6-bisphosphatase [Pectinatus haikarae]|uniref:Fructose-1,6-bisphosphatase class 3 n=1 Tax=Pectinatus haikarae TaxID=349096 RepID=A0ABT9Y6X3_9FIRM|nr:fructose-1,6-bisphosphatase [Pectinatus haikarae]MDQ0202904.1 fructose-1,6-bisphosphatase-3 [Pectinatus haikarae]